MVSATIISEIDSIAKETGNLSNSASEKAVRMRTSAGGFGVVALEIRQLSARCTASAKSMKMLEEKLAGIQRDPDLDAMLVSVRNLIEELTGISIFSNLLGINAAIEAAHVVGAGTDFRKLTDEIRTLAIRSADAARRTETLISTSVVQSRSGVTLSNEIDQHLAEAAAGADAISRLANEISKATTEQAGSIEQINELVSEINKVTQNNATSAADSLGAASNLSDQMKQLSGMVKKFKV